VENKLESMLTKLAACACTVVPVAVGTSTEAVLVVWEFPCCAATDNGNATATIISKSFTVHLNIGARPYSFAGAL
jgi:hypothetical protein